MEDISLHILDIAENSASAGAGTIIIRINEDREADTFTLEIEDDGRGMDPATAARAADPFFSGKGKKFGLGIPLLEQAAQETGGGILIDSRPGEGTRLKSSFRPSHIDMKPLGDIGRTMMALVMGHPDVRFVLEYTSGIYSFVFDTVKLKEEDSHEGKPFNSPGRPSAIKAMVNDGMKRRQM